MTAATRRTTGQRGSTIRRRAGTTAGGAMAIALALGLAGFEPLVSHADAQPGTTAISSSRATVIPQRATAIRLMRPVTVEFEDQRLEDVINFVAELTGADIDAKYLDDRATEGLDPDQLVSVAVENVTALRLLEMVLERSQSEFSTGGNSWQFTDLGTLEIGPKERLNARKRLEIYPIGDMIFHVPNYSEAPELDLEQILQSGGGGGGGGGQSPFEDSQGQDEFEPVDEEATSQEIMDIIRELIEPEQWRLNGGDAASMRYWRGNLIVTAPDYVHRQINGYPWWPAAGHTAALVNNRRWVSLNWDASFGNIEGFEQVPVSAVVGGRIIRSDDPGGGG